MLSKSFLERDIFYILFIIISLTLFNSFYVDKHLSADGVYYFAWILDNGDFIKFDWSRQFADYLSQWPLVLAVKFGLTNIQILLKFFALGLYFPFLISFLLCVYALRKEEKSLLIFPLLSMAAVCLSSDFILISESLVMANMSWPILLILLRREPLTCLDGIFLWILLLIFCRLYQTSIIPAFIYVFICIGRLLYDKDSRQKLILICAILLCLVVIAVSFYFILYPRDTANAEGFLFGMVASLLMSAAIILLIVKSLGQSRKKFKSVIFSILLILAIQIIIFVVIEQSLKAEILVHSLGDGALACASFINRSLTITLLPALLITAVLVRVCKIQLDRLCVFPLSLFILIMVAESFYTTNEWKVFRDQLTQIVKTGNGYIPIEDTSIKDNPCRWSWNNTELGLVWSAPNIKAILLNESRLNSNNHWQPFDPRETLILKRYLKYDDLLLPSL